MSGVLLEINDKVGSFRYLFLLLLAVIAIYLIKGWVLLLQNSSPLNWNAELNDRETEGLELLKKGETKQDDIVKLFFGRKAPKANLFYSYMVRIVAAGEDRLIVAKSCNREVGVIHKRCLC